MTDELDQLRDLARDLPWDKPSAQRRDAVRSSLLVEAAERSPADEGNALGRTGGSRRWLTIGGAFTAGALAAAAIAVLLVRTDPRIELPPASQITASSEAKLEHRVVTTETGIDEIVEVHTGKVTLAVPAVRRGDHVRVRTTTAEVEGDAGELEVSVVADALQSVTVRTGTAKIIATGQAPVFLAAGQTWRASVITTEITPSATDTAKTAAADTVKTATTDTVKTAATDTVKTAAADTVKTAATDTVKTATTDTVKTPLESTTRTVGPPAATVDRPTLDKPTNEKLTSDKPTSGKPTSGRPTSDKPTSDKPTSDKPTVDKPTSDNPTSDKPTSDKPTSDKPTSDKPAAVPSAAAKTDPKLAIVEKQFQRGWQLLRDGKAREAATELGAAADAMPEAPIAQDARYFQAVALVRAGDVAAAETVLMQFLDHAPKSLRRGRAAVLLGRVLALRGDRASARAWFESATTDPDPSIAAAARAGLQSLAKP